MTEPGQNGVADVGYTYDALHRVLTETSNGATHHYRYDVAGNRLGVQYGLAGGGNGKQIESTYDALNRLSTLSEGGRVTIYDYDLGGNILAKTLPNGDAVVSHYDSVGRAYEEEGISHQGVLYYYLSLCDAVGNLQSSFEYTANLPLRQVAMGYDAIDRLTSEQVTDSNGSITSGTSYVYDAANNRTQKIDGTGTTTYSFNNTNELTGWTNTQGRSASYGYDSNGNRLSRSANGLTDSYTYDAENRLVGLAKNTTDQPSTTLGSYSYQYDYRTRRVSRTENGSTTQLVFSGGTSVQEYNYQPSTLSSQLAAEYVRGSDWGGGVGGILYTMRGTTASFDHYDRRGDVTSRTDSSGNVTWQASYEAFGTRTQEQGTTPDRQRANTKEEDPTGLLNEGMRYRDLETGTFITRDPAGFVDGPNLYAYVRQNPWTKFDPEGLNESTGWIETGKGWFVDGALNTVMDLLPDPKMHAREIASGSSTAGDINACGVDRTAGGLKAVGHSIMAVVEWVPGAAVVEKGLANLAGKEAVTVAEREAVEVAERNLAKKAEQSASKTVEDTSGRLNKCNTKGKCFAAGTQVATPEGWRNIEDIQEGDFVYAFDEQTRECNEERVTEVLRHQTYWWVDVSMGGETISATRTHRFWVAEENGWEQAKDLRAGQHLRRLDGSLDEIVSVRLWETSTLTPTFNLEVQHDHTYFVGRAGLLVHNGDVDANTYEMPKDYPGKGMYGTDSDHAIPKGLDKSDKTLEYSSNKRPMPTAMNRVDKMREDVQLKKRFQQLVNDLMRKGGLSKEAAKDIAHRAMAEEIHAHANSLPARAMDPTQLENLCPKGL